MMARPLIGAFLLALVLFIKSIGGRIEGYLFPVVTIGAIVEYESVGETWTRIWGEAVRLRQCSFDHLVWYLDHQGEEAPADVISEEGTKVRGLGAFDFGPWLIQLTPSQLFERSHAIIYHRCHRLWLTESPFYR